MNGEIIICLSCSGLGYHECKQLVNHHTGDYNYWNEKCLPCEGKGRQMKVTTILYQPLPPDPVIKENK